jgi:hypothetical protein
MKNFLIIILAVSLTATLWAQSPEQVSYQAVVRNASDALVTSAEIGMKVSILKSSATGTAVYVETHKPTTNDNGLVSISIGGGTVVSGAFESIDWASGPFFIKTETDPAGGTSYSITGTSQLLSVPYALHAKTAENGITTAQADAITANTAKVGYSDALVSANASVAANTAKVGYSDALVSANASVAANTAKVSAATGTAAGQMQYWDGSEWVTVQPGFSRQVLTFSNGVPGWSNVEGCNNVHNPTIGEMQYWDGSEWVAVAAGNEGQVLRYVNGIPTWKSEVGNNFVINVTTGKAWMDRNLGASQVATSSTDADAYGDLYQWGRGADGHQIRTSGIILTNATTAVPNGGNSWDGLYITEGSSPYDWLTPQDNNLWQGVSGTNNPCPSGYRLPTEAEWNAELQSWLTEDAAGAFGSPLKLPMAGSRDYEDGLIKSSNFYWSSTISDDNASPYILNLYNTFASVPNTGHRALGASVRCIKD